MINRRAKGLRIQRKLRDMLECQGYMVYMVAHSRHQKDMWNLWDGVSLKRNEVFFLQSKTNITGLESKTRQHKEFCERYNVKGKIFNWIDKKREWHIIEYP